MYARLHGDSKLNMEFVNGIHEFIEYASGQSAYIQVNKIKCLYNVCHLRKFRGIEVVRLHQVKKDLFQIIMYGIGMGKLLRIIHPSSSHTTRQQ